MSSTMTTTAAVACQTGNNSVENGDDTIDDSHDESTDEAEYSHNGATDCT